MSIQRVIAINLDDTTVAQFHHINSYQERGATLLLWLSHDAARELYTELSESLRDDAYTATLDRVIS